MKKTPGEVEPPRQITKAEREARKAFRQVEAEKAMSEYEIAQKAFQRTASVSGLSGSHERLRCHRRRKPNLTRRGNEAIGCQPWLDA